jgi:malonyl-ACP O-methyltransferase BioC
MTGQVDKQLVEQQFRRAAASYDSQAMIQHRVADQLLALLEPLVRKDGREPVRVMETGCCTGLLTAKLVDRFAGIRQLLLNDLMEDFSQRLQQLPLPGEVTFLAGDIEAIPLPGQFDLIISSSTFHWLHDLDSLLEKLANSLAPGGRLVFSMYGPENLREIRSLTGIGLDYFSLAEVREMVGKYLTIEQSSEEQQVLQFEDPRQVLNHLRQTGVNALSRKPWTRGRLQRFCQQYRKEFSAGDRVCLTYHPLYTIARCHP